MKKFLAGLMLVVGVLTFSPVATHAMTVQEQIAQLQAQLNALLQILNQLLAQQGQVGTTSTTTQTVVGKELIQANLVLAYSSQSKESGLIASQYFTVTAGNQDIYVTSAWLKLINNGVIKSAPNGTTYVLTGAENTANRSFADNGGNNSSGWLVKAGQTSKFKVIMNMNPQIMYSGIYTTELGGVQIYVQNNWSNVVLTGNSMQSNPVTIVGENANTVKQPSITVSSPNSGSFVSGEKIRVVWQAQNLNQNNNLQANLYNPNNGDVAIKIMGNVAPGGSGAGDFYLDTTGVAAGQYFVNICDNNTPNPSATFKPLCSHGDYFTITSLPVVVINSPTSDQPAPAVSLTVNGSHSATIKPGDSVTYSWLNLFNKADKFSSSYTSNSASCGSGAWIANTSVGSVVSAPIPLSQVGCVWTATYTATQSSTGASVSDTVTVKVDSATPQPKLVPMSAPVVVNPSTLGVLGANTPIPTVNPVTLNITSASSPISYNSDFTLIGTGLDKVMDVYIGNYVWQKDIAFTASSDGTQIKFKINVNIAPGTYNVYADSVSTGSLVKSNVLTVNVVSPTSLNQNNLNSLASALEALKSLLGSYSR